MNKNKISKNLINKIIYGDCLEHLKNIPAESIDAVITDPPYGLKKNGIDNDSNLKIFYKVLFKCYPILKEDSWFITFFSTKYLPKLFIQNPFEYFWQIILYCPQAEVYSPIGITKFMSCFIFKKGNPKLAKKNKDLFIDTPSKMIEPDEGFIKHPTPKPKYLLKKIIKMFTKKNDIILDPFIGSGSTAVASIQLNRKYIGFEINKKYVRIARNRIKNFKKKEIS